MLNLDLPVEPYWLDLPRGVRVEIRPVTTAVMAAAQAGSARRLGALRAAETDLDPDMARGLAFAFLVKALARHAVTAWEGVTEEHTMTETTPASPDPAPAPPAPPIAPTPQENPVTTAPATPPDAAWHLAEAVAVEPDHGLAHAQQFARPRQVLEARDGRLRTQRGTVGQAAEGEFEGGAVAQAVGVVGVLVAGGDHQHPETQDIGHAVDDTPWCAWINDAGGETVGEPKPGFDLAQRQHAAVR